MNNSSDIIDQQVDDLRERMQLLQQDRRANVDILEAKKGGNIEEIRLLRDENKTLRLRLNQLQKRLTSGRGGQHELVVLQREALQLRTDFDSLKVTSNKHQHQLKKLKDEAKTCDLEATRPNQEDGPLSRKIRTLENRLDKAMIKYNEAQSIRSTYEHIVKRLKDERVSFNNQLTALERTLQAKKIDYDDLLLLAGDANHAREMAQHELHKARCNYEEKGTRREGELRERKQVVKIRRQMIEKQERRDVKKAEEAINLNMSEGDYTDGNTGTTCDSRHWPQEGGNFSMINEEKLAAEEDRRLEVYEEAFRKIKDATGVSDVNGVIEKMSGQESTKENLIFLTKQNQARIEQLNEESDTIRDVVEELKYNGKAFNTTRKMVDDQEDHFASSVCKLERSKNKYERISNTLASAKAGVKHLQNKIEAIGKELYVEQVPFKESNLGGALWSSGNILVEIVARIRERNMHDLQLNAEETEDIKLNLDFNEGEVQDTRPFNQRIVLPSAEDDFYATESCGDGDFGDGDDEELSRDRVKKASSQIIRVQEKKIARENRSDNNV